MVKQWIRDGLVRCVHLGTPCKIYSAHGRTWKRDLSETEMVDRLVNFSCDVIQLCLRRGVPFSLENPVSSLMWQHRRLSGLMKRKGTFLFQFDACEYNCTYKKPTRIFTNIASLTELSKLCTGGHRLEHLRGTVKLADGGAELGGLEGSVEGDSFTWQPGQEAASW